MTTGVETMDASSRRSEIMESVLAAYGNLDAPSFHFQEVRYEQLLKHQVVFELLGRYFVKNETDLNSHAALHLHVVHADGETMVCLSFVGNWAMMFQLRKGLYSAVIDEHSPAMTPADREIIRLLSKHGFRLLTGAEAVMPVEITLFDTPRDQARVYQALISDDEVLPEAVRRSAAGMQAGVRGCLPTAFASMLFTIAAAVWLRWSLTPE